MTDAQTESKRPTGRAGKTMIGAYVDKDALYTLQELLLRLSRERQAKVTMQDAISEALVQFAKGHGVTLKLD